MSKYYYHGTTRCSNYTKKTLNENINKIITILTTGGIKSKRLLNIKEDYGFNGLDYVSVCKKEHKEEYIYNPRNAFYNYIQERFCLIISDNIEAEKICNVLELSQEELRKINYKINRYSDMFDEYQVLNQIPIEYIIGIGLPFEINSIKELENLNILLNITNNLELDIVNTCDKYFVEKYEKNKEKVLKLKTK